MLLPRSFSMEPVALIVKSTNDKGVVDSED
jgi:hypothetical protein